MTRRVALLVAGLCAGIAACGLKGPLELPEKSTDIVIRGPSTGEPPAATGPAGSPETQPDEEEARKKQQ